MEAEPILALAKPSVDPLRAGEWRTEMAHGNAAPTTEGLAGREVFPLPYSPEEQAFSQGSKYAVATAP